MKKLTLIISTLLLISSTSAFAKKNTRNFIVDMGDKATCRAGKSGLSSISQLKDISFSGKCMGSKLVGKIGLRFNITPTQRYSIVFYSKKKARATAKALGMIWHKDVTVLAEFAERPPQFQKYANKYYVKGNVIVK